MSEHTPFLTIFPGCEDMKNSCGGLDKAYVTDVQVDTGSMALNVCAYFAAMPAPAEIAALSERLREDYRLNTAAIIPDYPRPKTAPAQSTAPKAPAGGAPTGDVLYGKTMSSTP